MNESHVEHAVGFIKHKELERLQRNRLLANQIEQAPRSRDKHIYAANQAPLLRGVVHAAENACGRYRGKLRILPKAIFHLYGELARRQKNQRTARLGRAHLAGIEQQLQNRERKGGRLARSRLGNSQEVLLFQETRDRFFLDGSGMLVAYGADRALQRICQGEFRK